MRAFAYIRVSGKGQLRKDGFPRQCDAIERHTQAKGYEWIAAFPERGVKGEVAGELRPAWSEMFAECRRQGITLVIIERLDRLARDLMIQETLLIEAARAGVTIESTCEPDLCSKDPTRVMFRQIIGSVAQYDKAQIVSKLRAARLRIRESVGRCEGKKPFGSHEGESETLAIMRDWYCKTGSYAAVANELNARGIRGRHGGMWRANLVSRILRREEKA